MKLLGLALAVLVAVGFGIAAAIGAFSGGSHPRRQASVRVGPTSQAQAAIRAARGSDPKLFEIFPRSGTRRCVIPVIEGLREAKLAGTCRTRVWYPNTHGHEEARVVFRESWGRDRFSSWTIWEELPTTRVLVTKLHGEPAPQLRYVATDSVDRAIGRATAVQG
jgi:hypothetical protein